MNPNVNFQNLTEIKLFFNKYVMSRRRLDTPADQIAFYLWIILSYSLAFTVLSHLIKYSKNALKILFYLLNIPSKLIQSVILHPFNSIYNLFSYTFSFIYYGIIFVFNLPVTLPYKLLQLKIKIVVTVLLFLSYLVYTVLIYFVYY